MFISDYKFILDADIFLLSPILFIHKNMNNDFWESPLYLSTSLLLKLWPLTLTVDFLESRLLLFLLPGNAGFLFFLLSLCLCQRFGFFFSFFCKSFCFFSLLFLGLCLCQRFFFLSSGFCRCLLFLGFCLFSCLNFKSEALTFSPLVFVTVGSFLSFSVSFTTSFLTSSVFSTTFWVALFVAFLTSCFAWLATFSVSLATSSAVEVTSPFNVANAALASFNSLVAACFSSTKRW